VQTKTSGKRSRREGGDPKRETDPDFFKIREGRGAGDWGEHKKSRSVKPPCNETPHEAGMMSGFEN